MTRAADLSKRAVITTEDLANIPSGAKNLIINGDMRIAQRGTSVTGITGSGYYTVDRWDIGAGIIGTWTMSQDTDVPNGQGFSNSMKWQCTTANASLSASSYFDIHQSLEGQMLQHLKYGTSNAEKLTLSFWVKSNKTGTYQMNLYSGDNGGKAVNGSITINSADTWEKKTIIYNGDTVSELDNDNGRSLDFQLIVAAGSNFTGGTTSSSWTTWTDSQRAPDLTVNLADSTSNYINITGVQLEVGEEATEFEHRPYDMELARCMRYYEKSYDYGTAVGTNTALGQVIAGGSQITNTTSFLSGNTQSFRVTKRATPTVTLWDRSGTINKITRFTLGQATNHGQTPNVVDMSERNFFVYTNSAETNSAGVIYHWRAEAEL